MAIVYTAILRERTLIASYSPQKIDFSKDILRLLPSNNSTIEQFILSNNVFSFYTFHDITFACVTLSTSDRRLPLNYLDNIYSKWFSVIDPMQQKINNVQEINETFNQQLGNYMRDYGSVEIKKKEKRKKQKERKKNKKRRKPIIIDEDDLENCSSFLQDDFGCSKEHDFESLQSSKPLIQHNLYDDDRNLKKFYDYSRTIFFSFIMIFIVCVVILVYCDGFTMKPSCF